MRLDTILSSSWWNCLPTKLASGASKFWQLFVKGSSRAGATSTRVWSILSPVASCWDSSVKRILRRSTCRLSRRNMLNYILQFWPMSVHRWPTSEDLVSISVYLILPVSLKQNIYRFYVKTTLWTRMQSLLDKGWRWSLSTTSDKSKIGT